MNSVIKDLVNKVYERLLKLNNPYYFFGIPNADYEQNGQTITLKKLELTFNKKDGESILKGYPFALKIREALGGRFVIEDGTPMLYIDDLKLQINSSEEIFIVYEVFVTWAYHYVPIRDAVFVDIGMNSGITSLYNARFQQIKRIYSFELFKPTYLLGMRNFDLNKKYSVKIIAKNYGLSDKAFDATIDYSESNKGRMGLSGLPPREHFSDAKKETVVVKNVNEIFDSIISESEGMDIIVKMDCEGEEFKLIDGLFRSGLLKKLTVIAIEWHKIQPTTMEEQLRLSGFHVFSQRFPNLDTGMIYATNGSYQ